MKFTFVSGVTIPRTIKPDENVFLHLSFENYIPDYMIPEGKGIYSSTRMVPPGSLHFFYSVEGEAYNATEGDLMKMNTPISVVNFIIA